VLKIAELLASFERHRAVLCDLKIDQFCFDARFETAKIVDLNDIHFETFNDNLHCKSEQQQCRFKCFVVLNEQMPNITMKEDECKENGNCIGM
jgi:hypothetical protein